MDELKRISIPESIFQSKLSFEKLTPKEIEQAKVDGFNSAAGNRNEKDGYDCPICKNKGFVGFLSENNGRYGMDVVFCQCNKVRSSIAKMNRSGLKNVIRDNTFERYEATEEWQKNIKAAAMEYAKNPEGWFYIGGQPGSGKTHLCTAICREFLLENKGVRYMQWRDEVAKLKEYSYDTDYRQSTMDDFKACEVLYIDDLFKCGKKPDGGEQRPTSADINIAFEILNFRYNNPALITIISSELGADDLMDIDEAIGSRIYEKTKPIKISRDRAKNYRMKNELVL